MQGEELEAEEVKQAEEELQGTEEVRPDIGSALVSSRFGTMRYDAPVSLCTSQTLLIQLGYGKEAGLPCLYFANEAGR